MTPSTSSERSGPPGRRVLDQLPEAADPEVDEVHGGLRPREHGLEHRAHEQHEDHRAEHAVREHAVDRARCARSRRSPGDTTALGERRLDRLVAALDVVRAPARRELVEPPRQHVRVVEHVGRRAARERVVLAVVEQQREREVVARALRAARACRGRRASSRSSTRCRCAGQLPEVRAPTARRRGPSAAAGARALRPSRPRCRSPARRAGARARASSMRSPRSRAESIMLSASTSGRPSSITCSAR